METNTEIILGSVENIAVTKIPQKKVVTEDLGKIFEMAICLLYGIHYDGKYKYSLEEAAKLQSRIVSLRTIFPYELRHTAKNGNQYDFTGTTDESIRLSAKTTKKDGKVCPQVIGQPSRKKFCDVFGLDIGKIDVSGNMDEVKQFIETNISTMLEIYAQNTFDCPIIYYNKHKDRLLYVKLKKHIVWSTYNVSFSHIVKNKKWNESSSIAINGVTIGEFQVHAHRDCIKFRWSFEKLLELFSDYFEIIHL